MNITYTSLFDMAVTQVSGVDIAHQLGNMSDGIQPCYGATAEDMGFDTFIMTIEWNESRRNKMIPIAEIDDDIKSLMSAVKWSE